MFFRNRLKLRCELINSCFLSMPFSREHIYQNLQRYHLLHLLYLCLIFLRDIIFILIFLRWLCFLYSFKINRRSSLHRHNLIIVISWPVSRFRSRRVIVNLILLLFFPMILIKNKSFLLLNRHLNLLKFSFESA